MTEKMAGQTAGSVGKMLMTAEDACKTNKRSKTADQLCRAISKAEDRESPKLCHGASGCL
jgi:hypothetical protein